MWGTKARAAEWHDAACTVVGGRGNAASDAALLSAYEALLVKVSPAPLGGKATPEHERLAMLGEGWVLATNLAESARAGRKDARQGLECVVGLIAVRGALESCRMHMRTEPPAPALPHETLTVQFRFDEHLMALALQWAEGVAKAEAPVSEKKQPTRPGQPPRVPRQSNTGWATTVLLGAAPALRDGLSRLPAVFGALFVALHNFLKMLPYGKAGTAAYRFLIEFADALKAQPQSAEGPTGPRWREHLRTLWESDDHRRVVELILWHIWGGNYKCKVERGAPHHALNGAGQGMHPSLTEYEVQYFFRQAVRGMPPEEVWKWLEEQKFLERSMWLDRMRTAVSAADDAVAAGDPNWPNQRNAVLEGSFLATDRVTFHNELYRFQYHQNTRRYTLRYVPRGEGAAEVTAVVSPVTAAPTGFPAPPQNIPPPTFVAQLEAGLFVWFRAKQKLEAYYRRPDPMHPEQYTFEEDKVFVRDEDVGEVVLTIRAMHQTLMCAPSATLKDDITAALRCHTGLAVALTTHVCKKAHLHNFQSVCVLLQAVEAVTSLGKVTELWFKQRPNGPLPSLNYASLLGAALEKKLLNETNITDVTALLRACARDEYASTDPLSVLRVISVSARDEFNGTWSWYNGYNHQLYGAAFSIAGHHVFLKHPALSTAVVGSGEYHGGVFRFSYYFSLGRYDETGRYEEYNVNVSVAMWVDPASSRVVGEWYDSEGTDEAVQCWFAQSAQDSADTPTAWGAGSCEAVGPALLNAIRGWDAAPAIKNFIDSDPPVDAAALIGFIFPAHGSPPTKGAKAAVHNMLLGLFAACAERLFVSAKRGVQFVNQLRADSWVLGYALRRALDEDDAMVLRTEGERGLGGLRSVQGIQATAAAQLLKAYMAHREVSWDLPPVLVSSVKQLAHIADVKPFLAAVHKTGEELCMRFEERRCPRTVYTMAEKYLPIHDANGVRLNLDADFKKPMRALTRMKTVMLDLRGRWNVEAAADDLEELEAVTKDADYIELAALEELERKWEGRLSVVLSMKGVIASPIFRAYFLQACQAVAPVPLGDLNKYFDKARDALRSITPASTVGAAVGHVAPADGDFNEARAGQEAALLAALGVDTQVVKLLIHGALPLRFKIHDMLAFRKLVLSPPADMKLRNGFFTSDDERAVLLQDDVDYVTLADTDSKLASISAASGGCHPRVLAVIRTMLQCDKVIAFARDHPQAQDAGLSSVLSNARDLQHASFQTFLNCAPFINAFVAASARHSEKFFGAKARLEAEAYDSPGSGGAPIPLMEVCEKTSLRVPVNNATSVAPDVQPEGFWAMLHAAFGDDENAKDVQKVQMNLERIATPDEVAKLENMLEEQCGAVDRMITRCRNAAGLGVHPDGSEVKPGVIEIRLPACGVPTLSCKIEVKGETVELSAAGYQDLVYRATLQSQVDPALEDFVRQASACHRAYNAAYALYSEGHIEFRSRTLVFHHTEGAQVNRVLQGLQGQWAARSGEVSVFEEACRGHPLLCCLLPAELVRLAELMRKLEAVKADGNVADARALMTPWRTPRAQACGRPPHAAAAAAETTLFPIAESPDPVRLGRDGETVNVGLAAGLYLPSFPVYKRSGGEAVLAPSFRGWGVYAKADRAAPCLLHSVDAHDFSAHPWQLFAWESPMQQPAGHAPVPPTDGTRRVRQDIRVSIDGEYEELPRWSTARAATKTVLVTSLQKLAPPPTDIMGDALYVTGHTNGVWEALGICMGACIVGVGGATQSTPVTIKDALKSACVGEYKKGFDVTFRHPWIWDRVPHGLLVDESRSTVTRTTANGGRQQSGAGYVMSYAPGLGSSFRIMLAGDVTGARVGVCPMPGKAAEPYWLGSDGVLYVGDRAVQEIPRGRFRTGDLITVTHSTKSKTISFKLNDVPLLGCFTGVTLSSGADLKPCALLGAKGASATLAAGTPATPRDFTWVPPPKSSPFVATGRTVRRRAGVNSPGVIVHPSSTVLEGPGPHTFHAKVLAPAAKYESIAVGLASPGALNGDKVQEGRAFFGMTVRANGKVFGTAGTGTVLHTTNIRAPAGAAGRPASAADAGGPRVLTFHVDLGHGSVDVFVNGHERIIHTDILRSNHPDFPVVQGPLVPYVWMDEGASQASGDGLGVEFVDGPLLPVPAGDPLVLVRRSGTEEGGAGGAEGIYAAHSKTYVREDGAFQLMNWGERWVITDPADRPYAWSTPSDAARPLGADALYWTVVNHYQSAPQYLRILTPYRPGGVLALQQGRKNDRPWYAGNGLILSWNASMNRWVVSSGSSKGTGIYCSTAAGRVALPHWCPDWMCGDGERWRCDSRVQLVACDGLEELRADSDGLAWYRREYGAGWEAAAPVALPGVAQLVPTFEAAAEVCPRGVAAAARGAMTGDEMVCCHIIRKATGKTPTSTRLRQVLLKVSEDAAKAGELRLLEQGDEAATKQQIRAAASRQLARIGQLLAEFAADKDVRLLLQAVNYDHSAPRFGMVRSRIIRGSVVDVSKLPEVDKKIFAMSLFEGDLRPHHILECSPQTPAEDVRAFLLLHQRMEQGRLLVLNVQHLPSDLLKEVHAEINRAAKSPIPGKELIAMVTGGDGTDESMEVVDSTVCDVQWRKIALTHVLKLNHFQSITYFDQPSGTGKSFTIKKLIEQGTRWPGVSKKPTRLDINSSTASRDFVCRRLTKPFLDEEGLLYVHVGHDADPGLVNYILDSLIFLGHVQSYSGLLASIAKGKWHLVVEFQDPPEQEEGHFVNPPWRVNGQSDVTVLGCRGLGEQGELLPFDTTAYPGLPEALHFVKQFAYGNRVQDEQKFIRTLALGIIDFPSDDDAAAVAAFDEALAAVNHRFIGRALQYLVAKHRLFMPPATGVARPNAGPRVDRSALVAHAIVHEMNQFVNPYAPNHFHLCVERHNIKIAYLDQMRFEGAIPKGVDAALQHHLATLAKDLKAMNISPVTKRNDEAPFHKLLAMLCSEVDVEVGDGLGALLGKNYVLIPHFLQKLVQVHSHIGLNDLVVLQGPSGTGKTYAVKILADLLLLNGPGTSVREGCRNVMKQLSKWVRQNAAVKRNFPDNAPDIKMGESQYGLLWRAQTDIKAWDNIEDCFQQLVDRDAMQPLDYVRVCLLDYLNPFLSDEEGNPDIAELKNPIPKTKVQRDIDNAKRAGAEYVELLGILQNGAKEPEAVMGSLIGLTRHLSKVSAGFLASQMVRCMEGALRSSRMQQLAGGMYEGFLVTLSRDRKMEKQLLWARNVLSKTAPYCQEQMARDLKAYLREELALSPLLDASPALHAKLAVNGTAAEPTTGDELEAIIHEVATLQRSPATKFVLMRYDLASAEELFAELRPTFERAQECPKIKFCVMVDEMNATKLLGLVKRIVVDRYWDLWEDVYPETQGSLPANIAFIGAINPSKKDRRLEGGADEDLEDDAAVDENLGFDVTPMPPSLMDFVVPWKQLTKRQIELFVGRLLRQNSWLYKTGIMENQYALLSGLLLRAHRFAQKACQDKRATISQRDLHRAIKVFGFFMKQGKDYMTDGRAASDDWAKALCSMLLGIAVSYYFRFLPSERAALSASLTEFIQDSVAVSRRGPAHQVLRGLPSGVTFAQVVKNAVDVFCSEDHLKLQEAVYAHQGLMENLFVQVVCFELRLAVILEGPPGTSKTLSNNIIRDNLTGRGDFWKDFCHISDFCRYQGSAQSSADEIKRKCEEAYRRQKESDNEGATNKRTLLFVDEAGLVHSEDAGRKWALKVLHYYLEGANLASVLMTNTTLDPAIGNRCIVVYMAKPAESELSRMCAGILHQKGLEGLSLEAREIIPLCCEAFHELVAQGSGGDDMVEYDPTQKFRWWYGLRDLFHMMRHIRRNQPAVDAPTPAVPVAGSAAPAKPPVQQVVVSPEIVLRALERNFNGTSDLFMGALATFGRVLGARHPAYSADALKALLRGNVDLVLDSIADNNRSTEGGGKNLNDMWVRFKLVVDNTDDGSLLQMLRHADVPGFDDSLSVLALSALAKGDALMPVTVVSQIVAAMELGSTVWLTNTREIDACLFDVFNQSFVAASSGTNEVLHFVAIAIGAALEYKQVHRNFQCIVHVTKKELRSMGKLLPSPFLNRLEKFSLSVPDVLAYKTKVSGLSAAHETLLGDIRQKVEAFEKSLVQSRGRAVMSASPRETFDSLVLEMLCGGPAGRKAPFKPAVARRIASDARLQELLYGQTKGDQLWRYTACKLLQVLSPQHMLLAQSVLGGSNAYLHAFFRCLSPWSIKEYLTELADQVEGAGQCCWRRAAVYAPANIDFVPLVDSVPRVQQVSLDSLIASERGQDVLRELLYAFAIDVSKSVFVLVVSPGSLGGAEVREVRHILNAPPEMGAAKGAQNAQQKKAVVVLQALPVAMVGGVVQCTPLFSTGWDQVYLDASGDHANVDMQRYVDTAVAGDRPQRKDLSWSDVEPSVAGAVQELLAAQAAVQADWAPVAATNPCFCWYNIDDGSLAEQTKVAREVLALCPMLQEAILQLYSERLPTREELMAMGQAIAAQEHSASLPLRILEGEGRISTSLVLIALRFLFDNRNASAIFAMHAAGQTAQLRQTERILTKALHLSAEPTNFEMLRKLRAAQLPPLSVGATDPALPGSSALMESLPVAPTETCARAVAASLQAQFKGSGVGELVGLIEEMPEFVQAFFQDSVRARVLSSDLKLTSQTAWWVYHIAKGLHREVFGDAPETVWSIHALCCVEATAVDAYVLALRPLAAMGVLESPNALAMLKDLEVSATEADWVAYELAPRLLLGAYEDMVGQGQDGKKLFLSAASALLRRVGTESVARSRWIPCLMFVTALLRRDACKPAALVGFIAEATSPENEGMALPALEDLMAKHPEALPQVVLACVHLHACLPEEHGQRLRPLIFSAVASGALPRALAARVMAPFIIGIPPPSSNDRETPWEVVRRGCLEALAPALQHAVQQHSAAQRQPLPTDAFPPPGSWGRLTVKPPRVSAYSSALYLAVWDVCFDLAVGLDGDHISGGTGICAALARGVLSFTTWANKIPARDGVRLLVDVVQVALQCSFVKMLSVAFLRPPKNDDAAYAPSFMNDAEERGVITELATSLMQPEGYVMPHKDEKRCITEVTTPPDLVAEYYAQLFFAGLTVGPTPALHGMGLRGAAQYLADQQTHEAPAGTPPAGTAIAAVCGEWVKFKCSITKAVPNAGLDLGFVTDNSDPLFEAYHVFLRQLDMVQEWDAKKAVASILENITSLSHVATRDKRLLVLYAGFRLFFLAQKSAPWGKVFAESPVLKAELKLSERQVALIHIAYNRDHMKTVCGQSYSRMGIIPALMEGGNNEWTEMIVTAVSIAAADPDSLLGSYALDIDAQRNFYTPGDKTGGAVSFGGGYKIDCVTQIDNNGNILAYGQNQDNLTAGSCYLLWSLTFGLWAWQMALQRTDAYETCWNWLVSGTLKAREHWDNSNAHDPLSNAEHLTQRFTERSVACHLHMATHTGLTPEESQKAFAMLLETFRQASHVQDHPLRRKNNATRCAAQEVEKEVEKAWRKLLVMKEKGAWKHESNASPNMTDMVGFHTAFLPLKRPRHVLAALDRLEIAERPELLTLVVKERAKLELLGPLLVAVHAFACKVHRLLSGVLPAKYQAADGSGEALTAYRGVLELISEHTSPQHHADAAALLDSIKRKWDAFRDNVGPIDYECAEGGINIYMNPGAEPRVGAPGLPDTLDFWITIGDSADHNDIIKGAVQSLTDKYNATQATFAKYSALELEDISLSALSVATPNMLLTDQGGLHELVRSYSDAALQQVDWQSIEEEVAFASGTVIPALRPATMPVFTFANEAGCESDLEKQARELLQMQPGRWAQRLDEAQAAALDARLRHADQEQHFGVLEVLIQTFKSRKAVKGSPLPAAVDALLADPQWRGDTLRGGGDTPDALPKALLASLFSGLCIDHLGAVMFVVAERVAREEWLSAEFCDPLHAPIPRAEVEALDAAFTAHMGEHDSGDVYLHIEDLQLVLGQLAEEFNDELPSNLPKADTALYPHLAAKLQDLICEEPTEENSVAYMYRTMRVGQTIDVMRTLKRHQRKLAQKQEDRSWKEPGATLREVPHWVQTVAAAGDTCGITFLQGSGGGGLDADEEAAVIKVVTDGSPAAAAGLEEGMVVMRVDGAPVSRAGEAEAALRKAAKAERLFEVTTSLDGGRPDADEIAKHITRSESYAAIPHLSSSRQMLQQVTRSHT